MYSVLIVDDKALIRKGIVASVDWSGLGLQMAGEADNGEHALRSIKEDKPDIVITDIRMPDMDGLELLKNICELDSQIVRIVISGYDDFEYAKKAIKYGSIDYIMKPIDPVELNESLKKACAILDKNKTYAPKNEQRLKDYFQKLFKEISLDEGEYRLLHEEHGFGSRLFCVAVMKSKTGGEAAKKPVPVQGLKICSFGEGNGVETIVAMTGKNEMSARSFELAVGKYLTDMASGIGEKEVAAGIGQVAENPEELAKSYKTACEAALCCMLPGSERMIAYSRLMDRKPPAFQIDAYERELMVNVSSGNANRVVQLLDELFARTLNTPEMTMENVRLLLRNLCYVLIKLNVEFENEIYDFLDKIGTPGYLLKYDSVDALCRVVYNFYHFAVQKYQEASGGKNAVITKVKSFIERNYPEDIGLNKLSDLFHINASYLTRIFKEEEGYSINEYIVKIRVENAKRILESGKVNIQKLAEAVGYEDSTYFFKVFKRVTGMTPREYLLKHTTK